jgi:hypothetical protein
VKHGSSVRLLSRNAKDLTDPYPKVRRPLPGLLLMSPVTSKPASRGP